MPKNAYMQKIKRAQTQKDIILTEWTAQLCLDIPTIVLNAELGIGRDRLEKVDKAWNEMFMEVYPLLQSKAEEDYIRTKIDGRLEQILGDRFVPWTKRYKNYRG